MATTQSGNGDMTKVWVMGKSTPGWYVAKQVWNDAYAKHLESLGYTVQRSVGQPE